MKSSIVGDGMYLGAELMWVAGQSLTGRCTYRALFVGFGGLRGGRPHDCTLAGEPLGTLVAATTARAPSE